MLNYVSPFSLYLLVSSLSPFSVYGVCQTMTSVSEINSKSTPENHDDLINKMTLALYRLKVFSVSVSAINCPHCFETFFICPANTPNWMWGHNRADIVWCQGDIRKQLHTSLDPQDSTVQVASFLSYPRESHSLYLAGTKDTALYEDCTY